MKEERGQVAHRGSHFPIEDFLWMVQGWAVRLGDLAPQSSNKQMEEPQTAVSALLGLISVAY